MNCIALGDSAAESTDAKLTSTIQCLSCVLDREFHSRFNIATCAPLIAPRSDYERVRDEIVHATPAVRGGTHRGSGGTTVLEIGRHAGRGCSRRLMSGIYFDIVRIVKSTDVVASLAALAQESRLAIFRMLVKRGPEGYTPSELLEKLRVAAPTLSFHLKELQHAGLIDVRRDGRHLFYRANFPHMNDLIGFLTENCCALSNQGCDTVCFPASGESTSPRRRRA